MEMTFNEYTSKMFSILETAIYNYEINTLVEAADGEDNAEKKESRWNNVKAIAKKVLGAIWAAIKTAYQKFIGFLNEIIHKPVVLTEDMVVYPGAIKFDSTLMRYANEITSGKIDNVDEINKYLDAIETTEKLAKGTTVDTKGLMGACKKYVAAIERLEKVSVNTEADPETLKVIQGTAKRISKLLTEYNSQAKNLVISKEIQNQTQKRDKVKAKLVDENAKLSDLHAKKLNNESVEADDIALSAALILEAANMLREDAEDYVDGIEGGEGAYMDIDDIPEERPEFTREYPADDITGGEGEKIDQEEIKDLLDGDKEAIAILNDDEGGKAITESVVIRF